MRQSISVDADDEKLMENYKCEIFHMLSSFFSLLFQVKYEVGRINVSLQPSQRTKYACFDSRVHCSSGSLGHMRNMALQHESI